MGMFLGTHQNRIDAKGRVSIPAPFRAALRAGSDSPTTQLVLRPSHKMPCIEAWPNAVFQELAEPLQRLDMFSETHDDLALSIYADAYPAETDKEGRIVLGESLMQHAGIADQVVFMGMGRTFQMWEPTAAARRRDEARERARARGMTLPGSGGTAAGAGPGSRVQ